jgi:hypothetical protein
VAERDLAAGELPQRDLSVAHEIGHSPEVDGFTIAGSRFEWTPWVDLETAFSEPVLPVEAGLYRIRRAGRANQEYIGQTGVGIRARVRMLKGIGRSDMPYRDPHTAGPALWALLHSTRCTFEVSCIPVEGEAPWRKGLESVAIALYRQETGHSPDVNFGRMPAGYRMSSGNNRRIVAAGKRFRGGATIELDASHGPGVPPAGGLDGDPRSEQWCGHSWSRWLPLSANRIASGEGLYRIRAREPGLLYIGEGSVSARIQAHLRKGANRTPTRQAYVLARAVEFSYVAGAWEPHQRLELESDLIAAHVLRFGRPPDAQFIN